MAARQSKEAAGRAKKTAFGNAAKGYDGADDTIIQSMTGAGQFDNWHTQRFGG